MTPFEIRLGDRPFNLLTTLHCGQVFRWKAVGNDRWVNADSDHVMVVGQEGSILRGFTSKSVTVVQDYFGLSAGNAREDDLEQAAPELADYFRSSRGLEFVYSTDPVETFATFICTANNHLARIVPMVHHLANHGVVLNEAYGVRRFPTIEVLAGLSEDALRAAGFGYRGKTIPLASRQVLERGGAAWFDELRRLKLDDAREELIQIYGLGPKLADCILLYGCGHSEAVPVDTHVYAMMCERVPVFDDGKGLTTRKYEAIGDWFRDRFGSRAGIAQQRAFAGRLFASSGAGGGFVKRIGQKLSPKDFEQGFRRGRVGKSSEK